MKMKVISILGLIQMTWAQLPLEKKSDFLAFCHTNIATGADTRMANTCFLVKESMWGDLAKPAAF